MLLLFFTVECVIACFLCIILIPYATSVANFVSFAASIAELAPGEKSQTQSLTHLPSLVDDPGIEVLRKESQTLQ